MTWLSGGVRGSDIVIQFQLGRRLTLLLMCKVGKAGSEESVSVKGNGNEKQEGRKILPLPCKRGQQSSRTVTLQTHTQALPVSHKSISYCQKKLCSTGTVIAHQI